MVRPRKGAKTDGGREDGDGDGDGSGGGRHHVAQPGPHPDLKEKFEIIYVNLYCIVCLTLGFLILLSYFPSHPILGNHIGGEVHLREGVA